MAADKFPARYRISIILRVVTVPFTLATQKYTFDRSNGTSVNYGILI